MTTAKFKQTKYLYNLALYHLYLSPSPSPPPLSLVM